MYRTLSTVAVSATLAALSVATIAAAAGSPSCTHFAAKGSTKGATTLSFTCAYGAKSAGYYRPSVLTVVTGGAGIPNVNSETYTAPNGSSGKGNCTSSGSTITCPFTFGAGKFAFTWVMVPLHSSGTLSSCGLGMSVKVTYAPAAKQVAVASGHAAAAC